MCGAGGNVQSIDSGNVRNCSESIQLSPRSRLLNTEAGPRANVQFTRTRMLGQGPDLLVDDALVDLAPGLSGVIAAEHSAFARAGVQAAWVVTVHDDGPAHRRVAVEGERLRFVVPAIGAGPKQPLVGADVQPPVRCYDHGIAPFVERHGRSLASFALGCRIITRPPGST